MENNSTHSTSSSDSFSLSRVGALFSFYGSTIRRQLLTYLCVSFVLSWLLLIPGSDEVRVALFGTIFSIIGWMNYLSPLSMTSRGRLCLVDTLLPVKASEKLVFFLLYFWIIVPFTLFLFPYLMEWWIISHPATISAHVRSLLELSLRPTFLMGAMNIFGAMWIIITCLYMVMYARRNRAVYGIIGVVCVEIVLGFMGGIYGGVMAFKKGFEDGFNGLDCPTASAETQMQLVNDFTKNILDSPFMGIIVVIEAVAVAAMVCALYRLLRKPNRS